MSETVNKSYISNALAHAPRPVTCNKLFGNEQAED